MNKDLIFDLVGMVATWVTVLFVYLTLREMQTQRLASYKPQLVVLPASVVAYTEPSYSGDIPRWRLKDAPAHDSPFVSEANIQVHNIGFGVAKTIQTTWAFDQDTLLKNIGKYCDKNGIPLLLASKPATFEIKYSESALAVFTHHTVQANFDYLMPVTLAAGGINVSLPDNFMLLLSAVLLIAQRDMARGAEQQGPAFIDLPEAKLPALKLEISFEDVASKRYRQRFVGSPRLISFTEPLPLADPRQIQAEVAFTFTDASL